MFNPDKLTKTAYETLSKTLELASKSSHPIAAPLHLALSLLTTPGPSIELAKKITTTLPELVQTLEDQLYVLPTSTESESPRVGSELAKILELADQDASKSSDQFISQEMLFISLTKSDGMNTLLAHHQLTESAIRKEMFRMQKNQSTASPNKDHQYQVLEKYTTNITQLAKDGKLDPVIGRDTEIRRVMQVLSRRTKNNPVLIGEPGVGKTAIVEGLAIRIMAGDVPSSLANKQLLSLEMASVLAGAKYRGEFEERFKSIIDEVQKQDGEVILFIDELHTVAGAGASEGAVDASNMLKPGLARGTLRVIGATTLNEYRQYIEKDSALERRFQPVMVNPPSVSDTISILRGLKEKYELHHGIHIEDDALVAAAELSDRYLSDRFLPDKAIDLIDEAASALKIETESEPEQLDQLNRHITQLEIEQKALSKDHDEATRTKLKELERQLADAKESQRTINTRWQEQKKLLTKHREIRNRIDLAKISLEKAERDIDLDTAAKIKYGDIPELQKELTHAEEKWQQLPHEERLIKQDVSGEDIALVVSRWTGIPTTKLLKTESEKLVHLEQLLGERVIGQKEALTAVANAVRRSRVGISDENKPLATFLFLGPTGVGKTETAKALADTLFDNEKAIIRLDMSEYAERHSVARLIGAPPGYVGYEEGGQLTEQVRRHPYSIILFDEIEKAHPQIFTLFLQILDEGRLTDGQGRTVNFTNTVIIMTSNLGAKILEDHHSGITAEVKQELWRLIEKTFPPEFINRLDQVIMFEPLKKEEIVSIVDLQLQKTADRLKKQEILLDVSTSAKQYLANIGYDPIYGARPLKRCIQTEILDPVAMILLENQNSGHHIFVDYNEKQKRLVIVKKSTLQ